MAKRGPGSELNKDNWESVVDAEGESQESLQARKLAMREKDHSSHHISFLYEEHGAPRRNFLNSSTRAEVAGPVPR